MILVCTRIFFSSLTYKGAIEIKAPTELYGDLSPHQLKLKPGFIGGKQD